MKIDDYLKNNGITRYKVSKISGISETSLLNMVNQDLRDVPVKYFQAIGLVLGKTGGQVFDEIMVDENPVFNFIAKYQITDKERISEIINLMNYFEKNNIDISNISFNRFEQDSNYTQAEALVAIDNLIASLSTARDNFENGDAPTPE